MSEVKWIKLSTDLFNNRKIQAIENMPDGDALIVIWLKILILAGETNDGGAIWFTREIPYTEQLLADQFRRPILTVRLALETFERFGMIDRCDDIIHVSNWEKYQNVDGMEKIREQTRKRVAKHREKQKLLECNVTVTQRNATDIDIDKERDKDKEIFIGEKTAKRFSPPTPEEVRAYCLERENGIDADQFCDYYAARGWKLKGQPMKDWKACVRTWERKEKETTRRTESAWERAERELKEEGIF